MKSLSYAWLLAAAIVVALAPTSAFAVSDNPKCPPFETCTPVGNHGGSDNDCIVGTSGCNTTKTPKANPAGNNDTSTCTSPNPNVCP